MVVGHGKSFLSVLVVPDQKLIKENVIEIIRREIDKVNVKLMAYERIKEFRILEEPFTIEKDELTPTLKIRRKIIEAKYKKVIDGIY